MPGKLFFGVVSIPIIASLYSVFFVSFGAMFAPSRRKETATFLYIVGVVIAYSVLWDFPTPITGGSPLWQPFVFTFIFGTISWLVVVAFENHSNRAHKKASQD